MSLNLPSSLLIIAGWGDYPRLLAEGARKAGVRHLCILGFRGSTNRNLKNLADVMESIPLGSIKLFLKKVQNFGADATVLCGRIHPLNLFRGRFDSATRAELQSLRVLNAHSIFGRLVDILNESGNQVLPASLFMAEHFANPGLLTRRQPSPAEKADINYGFEIAMATCNLDIGQTVVVKDGAVLAVEALEGTDAAIRRGARLGGAGAVVVKVAKDGHDMRFDIPVLGTRTLSVLRRNRIKTLGLQAGRVLILDKKRFTAEADKLGMAVESVESGLPYAPVFPLRCNLTGQE